MYYDENGNPLKNRIMTDENGSYYFNESGANVSGHLFYVVPGDEEDEWYVGDGTEPDSLAVFAMPDGILVKDSWIPVERAGTYLSHNPGRADWYYIDSNGYAVRDQVKDFDGETYFFQDAGIMVQSQWISYTADNKYSFKQYYIEDADNYYCTGSGAMAKNRTMYVTGIEENGVVVKAWFDFDQDGKATPITDAARLAELNTKLVTGIEAARDEFAIPVGDTVTLTWQVQGDIGVP